MDILFIAGIGIILVLSVTTHEAAHAWVADRLGDRTARSMGRLTLDPVPHIDPFWTLLLPALLIFFKSPFLFGAARPVPVDVTRLRGGPRGMALVAAAGPATNLCIAAILSALLAVFLRSGRFTPGAVGTEILAWGIYANVLLLVFNLLPIPPLDGSKVVAGLLPPAARYRYLALERFGMLPFLLLLFIPGLYWSLIGRWLVQTLAAVTALFGVHNEGFAALRPG